jgi:hypothetical protein
MALADIVHEVVLAALFSLGWVEGAFSVVAMSRPMEKPIPRAPRKATITGAAIAQKRQGSPATKPQIKRPARTIQPRQINAPPTLNLFICLFLPPNFELGILP